MELARLHLDFSTCFKRLKQYMDTHNREATDRKDMLSASMRSTAEAMLRIYIKQISGKVMIAPGSEDLPGFNTNNEAMATERGCTARTIINHRKRLMSAGIITHEQMRGNLGLKIWFNPVFTARQILEMPTPTEEKSASTNHDSSFPTMKNFQAIVHEHHEHKNKNRNVDKWISEMEDEKIMNTREMGSGSKEEQASPSRPSHSLLWMVECFWFRARAALYPHETFDKARNKAILNFIWETVYGKFHGDRDWKAHHQIALRRLEMVKRWIHRKPNRWVPLAEIYFDPLNDSNGFANTWKWYLKAITLQKKLQQQVVMKTYNTEWQMLDKGESRTTSIELYKRQHQRIKAEPAHIQTAYLKLLGQRIQLLQNGKDNTS